MTPQVISVIIAAVVMVFAILTFAFTRRKDTKEEDRMDHDAAQESREKLIRIDLKLDQINKSTTEINQEVKLLNNKIVEHDKKLAVIERDLGTAFIRIDELKGRSNDHS